MNRRPAVNACVKVLARIAQWIAATIALPAIMSAQSSQLSRGDFALVGRILLAEDRRDSTDAALTEGARHADPRVRVLAQRARGRIRDPLFAARDSLAPVPAPPVWPEAPW